jgi:hypothetical protein
MNSEIVRLKLPRGVWQQLIKDGINSKTYVVSHVQCSYPDANSVRFQLFNGANVIVSFSLSFLQGCSGVLVSHNMNVQPRFQGRGIAKTLQPIKKRIAQDLKVSLLIATVKDDNVAEKKVLNKDWQHVADFDNVKTGNKIGVHIRKIEPAAPEEITIDACGKNVEALVLDHAHDNSNDCDNCRG